MAAFVVARSLPKQVQRGRAMFKSEVCKERGVEERRAWRIFTLVVVVGFGPEGRTIQMLIKI